MGKEELQFDKMINTPVKKLIIKLGIPTTISMLVTSIYNIADTLFVARYNLDASSAVGLIFPLMAIIQAIGFMLGMGCGNMISSLLGEKENDKAKAYGSSTFYIGLLIGVILTIFGLIFLNPLVKLFGANDLNIKFTKDYGLFILIGSPIMIGSFILNNILRAEGKARFSMIGLTFGGILNIILDPIFIFSLDLGALGAAIATLISQIVSFIILLYMFISKRAIIDLSIKRISLKSSLYFEVIKLGFPSFCRQGLAAVATLVLNKQAVWIAVDDQTATAIQSAVSIVGKIFMVIFSISLGIGQGYQPVCGYNYFSKNYKRVKEAMLFTFFFAVTVITVLSILLFIFSNQVINFFITENGKSITDPMMVRAIARNIVNYTCITQPIMTINVICNMSYQSMRKKFNATLLSCCRQGIFYFPLVFILPKLLGIKGIELTLPGAEFLTAIFSIPFFISLIKHFNKKEKEVLQN